MTKNKKIILSTGGLMLSVTPMFVVASCGSDTSDTPSTTTKQDPHVAGQAWVTDSAEFKAMGQTEFTAARLMFNQLKSQTMFDDTKVDATTGVVSNPDQGKSIPVVFVDLDETILSNIAQENYGTISGNGYSPELFRNWSSAGQAEKIQGAIDFINYVWEHGGVVMYNSDREMFDPSATVDNPTGAAREGTKKNLELLGVKPQYLQDWTFWMQGINPTADKPWMTPNVVNGEIVHTNKETRMDTMNKKTTGYDLSGAKKPDGTAIASGNAVVLKTVMRMGDNIDDFNDLATRHTSNANRTKVFNDHLKSLFGSTESKGQIYTPGSNGAPGTWTDEAWNEGYVLIGGNTMYGGWDDSIRTDAKAAGKSQYEQYIKVLTDDSWDGSKTWVNPRNPKN
ncbi:MAG: hypothetical protein NC236_00075 [Mycoplasma sp.]|nr:hypothetical protein [Mycoplasma sp.]